MRKMHRVQIIPSRRARQKGFSFVEVLLVMVVSAILLAVASNALGGLMRWYGSVMTTRHLDQLREDIGRAYAENLASVENAAAGGSDTTTSLNFPDGVLTAAGAGGNRRCQTSASSFNGVASYLEMSPGKAYLDGFNAPVCILISPQQTTNSGGVTLYFHTIAIVSMGSDGFLSGATAFNGARLTLGGHNLGVVVGGAGVALQQFHTTQDRIAKAIAALQSYFMGRFQAASGNSTGVDYFGTGGTGWDTGGTLPVTAGTAMNGNATYYQALGLSALDVTDAYGQSLYLDNASDAVRSPNNASAAMNAAPPWSARVYTTLPGGTVYSQSAIGTY